MHPSTKLGTSPSTKLGARRITAVFLAASMAVACSSQPAAPQAAAAPAATGAAAPAAASDEGKQLSALAPENIAKARPKPPFDVTGNWFIDVSTNPEAWRFGPPYPKLTAVSQVEWDAAKKYTAEGKVYKDDIGQCWPAGLPLIMTRYWPTAMVQIPTAVYMISGFMNSVRIVYLDGRKHTDPDIIVRTYNGESIGTWEGDTLVVDTVGFRGDHHWMDQGGVAIPAGERLHIVERFKMVGPQLEIEYTMTDPEHWEGDWKSTKRFNRVNDEDIQEVSCLPDLNQHLQSTTSKTQVLK